MLFLVKTDDKVFYGVKNKNPKKKSIKDLFFSLSDYARDKTLFSFFFSFFFFFLVGGLLFCHRKTDAIAD